MIRKLITVATGYLLLDTLIRYHVAQQIADAAEEFAMQIENVKRDRFMGRSR